MMHRPKDFRPLHAPPYPEEGPFRDHPPTEIAETVGFLLATGAFRCFGRFRHLLQALGIDPPHHAVLLALEQDGPQTQKALSEAVNIDRTTMVHLLDELEAKNCVRRVRNPEDRRAHAVNLTEAGKGLLAEANARIREVEQEFLAPLSTDQQRQLRDLLHLLLRAPSAPAPQPDEAA